MANDADVSLCLEHFNEFNSMGSMKYAQVEIIASPFKAVRLRVGHNYLGIKEIPLFTRHYNLTKDGNVTYHDSYHL